MIKPKAKAQPKDKAVAVPEPAVLSAPLVSRPPTRSVEDLRADHAAATQRLAVLKQRAPRPVDEIVQQKLTIQRLAEAIAQAEP